MAAFEPTAPFPLTVKLVEVLPESCDCPDCGRACRRRGSGERDLMDIGLEGPVVLLVRMGKYRCELCQRWFRHPLEWAPARGHYSWRAREKCRVSVEEDQMAFRRVVDRVARDFHIQPSLSSVHRWWRAEGKEADPEYQDWVVEQFSGMLCVDGVHSGEFCCLVATDPIADLTLGVEIASGETKEAMVVLFTRLRELGIEPVIVSSDGRVGYPEAITQVWSAAAHHRCRFHLMQDLVKEIYAQVRAYRNGLPKPEKRGRGRPKKDAPPPPEDPRQEIWTARYLFCTRPEKLTDEQTQRLERLCQEHPRLRQIRDFMVDLFGLFEKTQYLFTRADRTLFYQQFVALHTQVPDLLQLFCQRVSLDTYLKGTLFWEFDNVESTNNHAERTVRSFRKRQKSHYNLRTRVSLNAYWNHHQQNQRPHHQPTEPVQARCPPAPAA